MIPSFFLLQWVLHARRDSLQDLPGLSGEGLGEGRPGSKCGLCWKGMARQRNRYLFNYGAADKYIGVAEVPVNPRAVRLRLRAHIVCGLILGETT